MTKITKVCIRCGKKKFLIEYHKDRQKRDNRTSRCKACIRLLPHVYYADRKRIYNTINKEKIAEYQKIYKENNSKYLKKYISDYNKVNSSKARERSRKRRELKYNINERYDKNDEIFTLKLFGEKCFKCSNIENLSIDHHYSLYSGNALTRNNAVVLCRSCNSSKGKRDPKNFYSKKELIILEKKLCLE